MSTDDFYEELDAQIQLNRFEQRLLVSSLHMLRMKFILFMLGAFTVACAIAGYVYWQVRHGDSFISHLDLLGGSLGFLGAFVVVELFLGAFGSLQAGWKTSALIDAQDHAIMQAEASLQDSE